MVEAPIILDMKHASERVYKEDCFIPEIVYKDAQEFKENCSEDNYCDCVDCWYFSYCMDCCELEDWENVFNDLKKYFRKKKLAKLLEK